MTAVMRQEPKWPVHESAQEFLMRTLSADQWRAIGEILKAERSGERVESPPGPVPHVPTKGPQ